MVGPAPLGGNRLKSLVRCPVQGLFSEQRRGHRADVDGTTTPSAKGAALDQRQKEFFRRRDRHTSSAASLPSLQTMAVRSARRRSAGNFHHDMWMANDRLWSGLKLV